MRVETPPPTTREIEERSRPLAGRAVSEYKLKALLIMFRGASLIVARDRDTRPVVRRALLMIIRHVEGEYTLSRAPVDGPSE